MNKFKPTIDYIKNEVSTYTIDDSPQICTDEQAKELLDKWFYNLESVFSDFIRDEVMEGEILNTESESDE